MTTLLFRFPWLPWALIPVGLYLSIAAVRRWLPGAWTWLEKLGPAGKLASKAWQASPAVLAGAVLGAWQGGGDYQRAALGALLGLVAPVGHELLETWRAVRLTPAVAPEEPTNPTPSPDRRATPPGAAALLLLPLLPALWSCSATQKPPDPLVVAEAACHALVSGHVAAGKCDGFSSLDQCPNFLEDMRQCGIWLDQAEHGILPDGGAP